MSAPLTGQVVVSGAAQQVSAAVPPVETVAYILKAPLTNINPVYIGTSGVSSSTGFQLDPGDELSYERLNQQGQPTYAIELTNWYVVGTSPDKLTWLASV